MLQMLLGRVVAAARFGALPGSGAVVVPNTGTGAGKIGDELDYLMLMLLVA